MFDFDSVRRFLILTNDSGFGHRSAANSIARALTQQHSDDTRVFVVNPLVDRSTPLILRKTEHDYDRNVIKSPQWYRFTYEISDSRVASTLVEGTLVLSLYRNLKQVIDELQPDAVLTTNELFSAPLGALRRYGKHKFPFFSVVTDLADVHAMWFNPNPDLLFVANEGVKTQAMSHGIPGNRVVVSGIPVDIGFAQAKGDKVQLRRELGIDPWLRTILLVGSKRVNGIYENLVHLEELRIPFQAAVISGGDDEVFAKIAARRWKFPVHLEKFVTNMPKWMAAADILVTKAGGLILSEAMASGLPVILIDNLPGQESGNVRYILEHNAGARVEDRVEFLEIVSQWLNDSEPTLRELKANAYKLGHPGAAFEIADVLWNSAQGTFELPVVKHGRDLSAYFQGKGT